MQLPPSFAVNLSPRRNLRREHLLNWMGCDWEKRGSPWTLSLFCVNYAAFDSGVRGILGGFLLNAQLSFSGLGTFAALNNQRSQTARKTLSALESPGGYERARGLSIFRSLFIMATFELCAISWLARVALFDSSACRFLTDSFRARQLAIASDWPADK